MSNELMQQAAAKDTTDYGQSPLTDDEQKNLVKQIQAEYALAKEHQRESLVTKLARMKLYNNEKKDPKRVSDLSLFSIMQTVLAALYTNKLSAVFEGWEDGDDSVASNLNDMAEYDYKKMKKHILDYFWIWDTCFHGRGLISLEEFDRDEKMMCPVPGYIDAMTFLRDPLASSVNGLIHGDTGMRFGGYEATVLKSSLDAKNGYFNFDDIIYEDEIDSLMEEAKRQRDMAQGLNTVLNRTLSTADLGDNIIYPVLYWYTSFKGKKCKVTLCNSRNKIIKYTVFKKDSFPIIDRPLFPHSNSWDGVSISTIVEDKQRHKSALLNITMDAVKSNVYPSYLYDESRIKNKADIRKMDFNKLIGVKGGQGNLSAALEPVNKADVRVDLVNYILSALDTSAQTASSSPDMQQGQLSGKERTLGELNMVQSNVAKRYSLASKVFSWSEEAFWQEYYWLYKNYFIDGIDEKMIRIRGSFGSKPRKLLKDNIIAEVDPDVYVESKDDNNAGNAEGGHLKHNGKKNYIYGKPMAGWLSRIWGLCRDW